MRSKRPPRRVTAGYRAGYLDGLSSLRAKMASLHSEQELSAAPLRVRMVAVP